MISCLEAQQLDDIRLIVIRACQASRITWRAAYCARISVERGTLFRRLVSTNIAFQACGALEALRRRESLANTSQSVFLWLR